MARFFTRLLLATLGGCSATPITEGTTPSADYIRLERTECLGRCPIYRVTLFRDGTALYDGQKHAPTGRKRRQIDPREVDRLIDAFDKVGSWKCDPERIATDYPDAIVTVHRHGRTRSLRHNYGDPCAPGGPKDH